MYPSLFVAHGAPLLAVENNEYTRFINELPKSLIKPKAVIVFSAHWESKVQMISNAEHYEMIYDFRGFSDELYHIQYPAKGSKETAEEIKALLQEQGISCQMDSNRGLDHGAWVVLGLLYPKANIPVISMSVNPKLVPEEQYRIGRALSSLRAKDVLILGSGGTVHNLRRLAWNQLRVENWAVHFDDWLAEQMEHWNLEALFDYETRAPFAKEAVPSTEHFIPILIAMGAADDLRRAKRLYRSYQYGNLSLSCWKFG